MRDVSKLFRWGNVLTERTLVRLVEKGSVVTE